jgi:hypothetical protein
MYATDKSLDLIQASRDCTRTLRRIILCQTPSERGVHKAISLFDNWEIGYTSKGDTGWRTIRYAKYFIEKQPYFPEVFVDVVFHKKLLVAVDIYGVVFLWRMDDDEVTITCGEYPYVRSPARTVFYLAKSPYDDLILIVVQGHGEALENTYYRVLESEHNKFETVEYMRLYKYDDAGGTWIHMDALDFGASIFVGLNYPFQGSWNGIVLNRVYVSNIVDSDVIVFGNEDGVYRTFRKLNYPCTPGARLLRRQMMRPPIWFRPTTPLNNISIRGLLV